MSIILGVGSIPEDGLCPRVWVSSPYSVSYSLIQYFLINRARMFSVHVLCSKASTILVTVQCHGYFLSFGRLLCNCRQQKIRINEMKWITDIAIILYHLLEPFIRHSLRPLNRNYTPTISCTEYNLIDSPSFWSLFWIHFYCIDWSRSGSFWNHVMPIVSMI